jgi:hypothetical protein
MSQVSKRIRDLIKEQMRVWFNDNVDQSLQEYELSGDQIGWKGIDWTLGSDNFFFGRLSPALLEQSTPFRYPLLTIDTLRSQNNPRGIKVTEFGGQVSAVIDVHLSWTEDSAIQDFASWADAFEDALYATMNDDTAFVGGNVIYNRDISVNRGPIVFGAQNWRQSLSCPVSFLVLND